MNKLSLLDLGLQDQYEVHSYREQTLGLSVMLQANQINEKYITQRAMKIVLQTIEDKFREIEDRLNNRDDFVNQTMIQKPMMLSDGFHVRTDSHLSIPMSRKDRSNSSHTEAPSQVSQKHPPKEESMIKKLELFEKKLKVQTETISKQQQTIEQFQRKIEHQVQQAIKDCEHTVSQGNKQQKDMAFWHSEVSDHQKSSMRHITDLRQRLDQLSNELSLVKDDIQTGQYQVASTLQAVNELGRENVKELENHKLQIEGLESELLTMMKNYKDLLMESSIRQDIQTVTIQPSMQRYSSRPKR